MRITATTGITYGKLDQDSRHVDVEKINIPATTASGTVTVYPEPGMECVFVKPDINGSGSLAVTAYQSLSDTEEVAETLTLSDSLSNKLEGLARIVFTYSGGDTASWIFLREIISNLS